MSKFLPYLTIAGVIIFSVSVGLMTWLTVSAAVGLLAWLLITAGREQPSTLDDHDPGANQKESTVL